MDNHDDLLGWPLMLAIMLALVALVAGPVWLALRVVTARLPIP